MTRCYAFQIWDPSDLSDPDWAQIRRLEEAGWIRENCPEPSYRIYDVLDERAVERIPWRNQVVCLFTEPSATTQESPVPE